MLFRLSPYCVFYPDPDGSHVTLIHSLYGSKFQLSSEMFQVLAAFLPGCAVDNQDAVDPSSSAIQELIEEKVLIGEREFSELGGEKLFQGRLRPLELAFQREFTEGGYFPGTLDRSQTPDVMKRVKGLKSFSLRKHSDFPKRDLFGSLEARRSIRSYAPRPMEKRKLEQFLQATAQAHALVETREFGTTSLRNYPSGGARYPLEVYPLVENVQSLHKGIYYYHPFQHRLELISQDRRYRTALVNSAMQRMGTEATRDGRPAVLFLVTAVFGRTAWKYRGIPLHLILQEVGALYQTMYLAAAALGLAACPVGAFPERAVAEILNLDSRDESEVGMFALGVPRVSHKLSIEDFEVRRGSPFDRSPRARSAALVFSDGQREILALADFQPERSAAGVVSCRVLRGRYRAELGARALRKLARMLKGKGKDPELSSRFAHLAG
ncbi:MAG: SagB/ThcOx family dehydrogenase [Acidobacteriia bacterium]|nr:SagB/ThcOx family dehydrogenase [Terriglobia bacterium]